MSLCAGASSRSEPATALQVCNTLVCAVAAYCFWFFQPYYRGLINGAVVGGLAVGGLGSVLALLLLLIPNPDIAALLGWLYIPVFLLVFPLGMQTTRLRYVKRRGVSSEAFPTSIKFPFVDCAEPTTVDAETLEQPNAGALSSVISLPIYQEALPDDPQSVVLSTGISVLRSGSHADLGMRFMWKRRDLPPDFLQNLIRFGMDYFDAALLRFPDNALLRVHYAIFLVEYARRTTMAFNHLKIVLQQQVVPLDAWYLAHRVGQNILGRCKNTRDVEAREMLNRIKVHHRASLASTVSLWSMLMSDGFEITALDQLTTTISSHNNAALTLFQQLGSNPAQQRNPLVLRRFGHFLRTAVGDSEAAEALECEAELIEAEQVALSGAKKVGTASASGSRRSGGSSATGRSGNTAQNEQVESAAHQWMTKGGHRNEKANASKRRLSNCLKAVFAALCLLLSFSAGLFIYFTTNVEEHMHQIAVASSVRTDSARSAALVLAAQVTNFQCAILRLRLQASSRLEGRFSIF